MPELEPIPVTLARVEGKIDLVFDRVDGLMTRVDRHEAEIGNLKSTTQTLTEGAFSSKETAIALAAALKEADEARRTNADAAWSPFAKTITAMAAFVGLATLFIQTRGA